jgi:hypothetical protein
MMSRADLENYWAVLDSSFRIIISGNASILSYESLYRICYRLVLQKEGEFLYEKILDWHKNWLQTQALPEIKGAAEKFSVAEILPYSHCELTLDNGSINGSEILLSTFRTWNAYALCTSMVSDVAMYLVSIAFIHISSLYFCWLKTQ